MVYMIWKDTIKFSKNQIPNFVEIFEEVHFFGKEEKKGATLAAGTSGTADTMDVFLTYGK